MHHEIRRAPLSFKGGGGREARGEERKKMKDFRRGSKGFTNHITERAQTTDEVRIQKIVERAFKIIN